ncbi:MAG: hypothetical protein AABX33_04825 [Nanoarchaeota archaeon]|mgnify:CR=1 FL=1
MNRNFILIGLIFTIIVIGGCSSKNLQRGVPEFPISDRAEAYVTILTFDESIDRARTEKIDYFIPLKIKARIDNITNYRRDSRAEYPQLKISDTIDLSLNSVKEVTKVASELVCPESSTKSELNNSGVGCAPTDSVSTKDFSLKDAAEYVYNHKGKQVAVSIECLQKDCIELKWEGSIIVENLPTQ